MTPSSARPVFAPKELIATYMCFKIEEEKHTLSFLTMKVSVDACMEFLGFSSSTKVENHCIKQSKGRVMHFQRIYV